MNYAEIRSFPSSLLFDIARNEQAQREARLIATEELIDRDDRRALHTDLAALANEILAGRTDRKPTEKVHPAVQVATGPPQASVTTASLMQNETIEEPED